MRLKLKQLFSFAIRSFIFVGIGVVYSFVIPSIASADENLPEMVKDIYSRILDSAPEGFVDVEGVAFFAAKIGVDNEELWKSDGTEEGTVLVDDILMGGDSSNPSYLTNADGTLYFSADNGANGFELWKLETPMEDEGSNEDEEDNSTGRPKILAWKAIIYADVNKSCAERLKLTLEGRRFDDDAEVFVGGRRASSVDVKNSRKMTAKFCLATLLGNKTDHKRIVGVKNPNERMGISARQIDIERLFFWNSESYFDQQSIEGILRIQRILNKIGYLHAAHITGVYGPITIESVRRFQRESGVDSTGFVGPATTEKLRERVEFSSKWQP